MNHADHVALLRPGLPGVGGVWADLGSGDGAFTLALAELVGPGATIYSIDRDQAALDRQRTRMRAMFPTALVHYRRADLALPLVLPPLDGVVLSNVLHFFREPVSLLRRVHDLLRPGGCLLLVEYNVDEGNRWVPYPLSFATFSHAAQAAGLANIGLLAARPSRFLGEIYSARAFRVATNATYSG